MSVAEFVVPSFGSLGVGGRLIRPARSIRLELHTPASTSRAPVTRIETFAAAGVMLAHRPTQRDSAT